MTISLKDPKQMQRCTFAIISHPDAGKTTLTEKFLLFGGAIQLAGVVKGKKSSRYTVSDWMALERERGISVKTSVMQFIYQNRMMNLIDTPGHVDFSEDTYRTLTAVDSALMVIDAGKGVESRTIKLLEICRSRHIPILTFINKCDRDCRHLFEVLDEIESVLKIRCAPITWPIGTGRDFKGVYHLYRDEFILYEPGKGESIQESKTSAALANPVLEELVGSEDAKRFRDEVSLVREASSQMSKEDYLKGNLTPIFFGSALNNFGVRELLNGFIEYAPQPGEFKAQERVIKPDENKFTGFVFKIQANMDPQHHDRIAFVRICSGHFEEGMKLYHSRLQRYFPVSSALTFMAAAREATSFALPGDIIGLHNYGTMQIGDTFTEGESLQFLGIPHFAPELFRIVHLKDPLKWKALQKGLNQLSEEGATQVFRPLRNNDLILGAVGSLQFDVVAFRLKNEYNVECVYESIAVNTARWIECDKKEMLEQFKERLFDHLALDSSGQLAYLAPSKINLNLTMERWPQVQFFETKEHAPVSE